MSSVRRSVRVNGIERHADKGLPSFRCHRNPHLDDPTRFSQSKAVGSYFGLVPAQDQSGSTNRLGHITRNGPAVVRQMLAEAAWHAIRLSPTIQQYYRRIAQDNQERKKIALVATAHYLARVMHAMLRDNRPWQETASAA